MRRPQPMPPGAIRELSRLLQSVPRPKPTINEPSACGCEPPSIFRPCRWRRRWAGISAPSRICSRDTCTRAPRHWSA
jgi:hypothetical protein